MIQFHTLRWIGQRRRPPPPRANQPLVIIKEETWRRARLTRNYVPACVTSKEPTNPPGARAQRGSIGRTSPAHTSQFSPPKKDWEREGEREIVLGFLGHLNLGLGRDGGVRVAGGVVPSQLSVRGRDDLNGAVTIRRGKRSSEKASAGSRAGSGGPRRRRRGFHSFGPACSRSTSRLFFFAEKKKTISKHNDSNKLDSGLGRPSVKLLGSGP